jgi:hypothetical protein
MHPALPQRTWKVIADGADALFGREDAEAVETAGWRLAGGLGYLVQCSLRFAIHWR